VEKIGCGTRPDKGAETGWPGPSYAQARRQTMLGLISIAITVAVAWFGYGAARRFVRQRLRYVDGAHWAGSAIIAAVGATLIAWPVAWLLPLVGVGTAVAFGLAVGLGTRAGSADIKRGDRLTDER